MRIIARLLAPVVLALWLVVWTIGMAIILLGVIVSFFVWCVTGSFDWYWDRIFQPIGIFLFEDYWGFYKEMCT